METRSFSTSAARRAATLPPRACLRPLAPSPRPRGAAPRSREDAQRLRRTVRWGGRASRADRTRGGFAARLDERDAAGTLKVANEAARERADSTSVALATESGPLLTAAEVVARPARRERPYVRALSKAGVLRSVRLSPGGRLRTWSGSSAERTEADSPLLTSAASTAARRRTGEWSATSSGSTTAAGSSASGRRRRSPRPGTCARRSARTNRGDGAAAAGAAEGGGVRRRRRSGVCVGDGDAAEPFERLAPGD